MDPRSNSKEKIIPPAPLPHVSRRALAMVGNWMEPPTRCPYCLGKVELVDNSLIYGRRYGDWPYAYRCAGSCDAHVGLHPNTDIPLGTIAKKELREARTRSKNVFHRMKKTLGRSRSEAYKLLAGKMGLEKEKCHFGWFDEYDCRRAREICIELINQELARNGDIAHAME